MASHVSAGLSRAPGKFHIMAKLYLFSWRRQENSMNATKDRKRRPGSRGPIERPPGGLSIGQIGLLDGRAQEGEEVGGTVKNAIK